MRILLMAGFLLTRLPILWLLDTPESDILLYARYAQMYEQSRRAGTQFYSQVPEFEYPAYGLLPVVLISRIQDLVFAETEDHPERAYRNYKCLFRSLMLVMETLVFLLWLNLIPGIQPRESPPQLFYRGMILQLGMLAMTPYLYDRLDMVVALLLLVVISGILRGKHAYRVLGCLALAVVYKIIPVVILPVIIVFLARIRDGRRGMRMLEYSLLFLTMLGLMYLPAVLCEGWSSLHFIIIQAQRGIHIESAYSAIAMLLKPAGLPLQAVRGQGSWEILELNTGIIRTLTTVTLAGSLGAAYFILFCNRVSRTNSAQDQFPAAGVMNNLVKSLVLVLLTAVFFSRTFSPQYFIFIMPLAALVSLGSRRRTMIFLLGMVLLLGVNTLIFPYTYVELVALLSTASQLAVLRTIFFMLILLMIMIDIVKEGKFRPSG